MKIFYLNYYKDRDSSLTIVEPEKTNIYKLIYLNSISHELISMNLSHSNFIENEVIKIKKKVDTLRSLDKEIIKGEFIFRKIKKGFKVFESFQAHQKFIGGLITTRNNNRIITSSKDYILKAWDPKAEKKRVQEIPSMKIINLLSLKNGKILASRENDILIFELDEKKKYKNTQSLSDHKGLVFALAELDDGKIISGAKDKRIVLWEETPDRKEYQKKQEILTNKEIQIITILNEFKIADYKQICELKGHKGQVICICKLNLGYMASGDGDLEEKTNHSIYIWKPKEKGFELEQILKGAHNSDVNCIILLRDGRMASSSRDRTIKTWGINKYKIKTNNKIEFVLQQTLNEYKHGLYKMVQLEDDAIVACSSDNYLVFWNHPNIF